MDTCWRMAVVFAFNLLLVAVPASAAPTEPFAETLDRIGLEATRMVNSDLCYPETGEEYEALGKNGVIRIEAISALSSELPLKAAYLELKGLKIPLRRLVQTQRTEDERPSTASGTRYWRQVTFYLAPLSLVRAGARLVVDFNGQRAGFGVTQFEVGGAGPAFVRLDEYNTPSEPDLEALGRLISREYPEDAELLIKA